MELKTSLERCSLDHRLPTQSHQTGRQQYTQDQGQGLNSATSCRIPDPVSLFGDPAPKLGDPLEFLQRNITVGHHSSIHTSSLTAENRRQEDVLLSKQVSNKKLI